MRLSLGCGERKEDGWIGLDAVDFGWNETWCAPDPLPYADSSVDEIKMDNFIEHVDRTVALKVFNECHRVLRANGICYFTAPNAAKSIDIAMADLTHKSLWVTGVSKYLSGEKPRNADYGIRPWEILEIKDHPRDERIFTMLMRPKKGG